MGRPRKKPLELTDEFMGINPLMANKTIPVRRIRELKEDNENVVNSSYALLETTAYTKLFEGINYKQNMGKLSTRAKELLLYFLYYIPAGKDYMWIDRVAYMDVNDIKSNNTYLSAVKELCADPIYIYPHVDLKDVFWINPLIFYKGSRINKYSGHLTIKKYIKKEVVNG